MNEIWKNIPGYGGKYEVSDQGRVRSYARGAAHVLAPGRMSGGHLSVALGRGNTRTVHSLVMETFVGPVPPGKEVRHLDGEHFNNRLKNLEYATRSRNGQDKKHHKGQSTYRLSPCQASRIKAGLRDGCVGAALANTYGVAQSTISAIKHGRFHNDIA